MLVIHAEAHLTSHFWIPTFWKTAPTLWYYQCNPKYRLNWRHGEGAAPHTGNTNSLLLTCPHASNFKSFLYALPAGHSETQRSDPGFKAFAVQRYMVLSLAMHPWLQEKKASMKAWNAQEHSSSQPAAGQRVGRCQNSSPARHHPLSTSPMSSQPQRRRLCQGTPSIPPATSPCSTHSRLGTHTRRAPRGKRLPRSPGLGLTASWPCGREGGVSAPPPSLPSVSEAVSRKRDKAAIIIRGFETGRDGGG